MSPYKPRIRKCTLTKHQSPLDKCDPGNTSITVFWTAEKMLMNPEGHLRKAQRKQTRMRIYILHQMARIQQATPYLAISKSINSSQKKQHLVFITCNYLLM